MSISSTTTPTSENFGGVATDESGGYLGMILGASVEDVQTQFQNWVEVNAFSADAEPETLVWSEDTDPATTNLVGTLTAAGVRFHIAPVQTFTASGATQPTDL